MQNKIAYAFIILLLLGCRIGGNEKDVHSTIPEPDNLKELLKNNRKAFVTSLVSNENSDYEKTRLIVNWLTTNLDWLATDYKTRNVQEIIDRGGGNCKDLAQVTINLLDIAKIKKRRIKEINLHVSSNQRHIDAVKKMNEEGNRYSVFGRIHNDHVWIEVFDQNSNNWIPADPSLGLVGLDNWMKGRVIFEERITLDPLSKDMIIPVAIFVQDSLGNFSQNRTEHYLINEFNRQYHSKLSTLNSWNNWKKRIKEIDDKCLQAFKGNINLHKYYNELDQLKSVYFNLKKEYRDLN